MTKLVRLYDHPLRERVGKIEPHPRDRRRLGSISGLAPLGGACGQRVAQPLGGFLGWAKQPLDEVDEIKAVQSPAREAGARQPLANHLQPTVTGTGILRPAVARRTPGATTIRVVLVRCAPPAQDSAPGGDATCRARTSTACAYVDGRPTSTVRTTARHAQQAVAAIQLVIPRGRPATGDIVQIDRRIKGAVAKHDLDRTRKTGRETGPGRRPPPRSGPPP